MPDTTGKGRNNAWRRSYQAAGKGAGLAGLVPLPLLGFRESFDSKRNPSCKVNAEVRNLYFVDAGRVRSTSARANKHSVSCFQFDLSRAGGHSGFSMAFLRNVRARGFRIFALTSLAKLVSSTALLSCVGATGGG